MPAQAGIQDDSRAFPTSRLDLDPCLRRGDSVTSTAMRSGCDCVIPMHVGYDCVTPTQPGYDCVMPAKAGIQYHLRPLPTSRLDLDPCLRRGDKVTSTAMRSGCDCVIPMHVGYDCVTPTQPGYDSVMPAQAGIQNHSRPLPTSRLVLDPCLRRGAIVTFMATAAFYVRHHSKTCPLRDAARIATLIRRIGGPGRIGH